MVSGGLEILGAYEGKIPLGVLARGERPALGMLFVDVRSGRLSLSNTYAKFLCIMLFLEAFFCGRCA